MAYEDEIHTTNISFIMRQNLDDLDLMMAGGMVVQ